jgi:plastocyanin
LKARAGYAGLVAALTVMASCGEAGVARVHEVEMRATAYTPEELRVAMGDTIVFVNRDLVAHTATSASAAIKSGDLPVGAEWWMIAGAAGRYDYWCEYHPTMKGSIVVE